MEVEVVVVGGSGNVYIGLGCAGVLEVLDLVFIGRVYVGNGLVEMVI